MITSPTVFVSYSHDNEAHKEWVLAIASRLVENGVNAILDQWDLRVGANLPKFMQNGLANSDRVLVICTDNYNKKSNEGVGGVGYEQNILTAELFLDQDTTKFISIVRAVTANYKTPICLGGRVYIDFSDDSKEETSFDILLREIYGIQAKPKPALGKNPFIVDAKPSLKGESSTAFFSRRFSGAFPGVRGIKWFEDSSEAIERLSLLLQEPLEFSNGSPIWWWRTGDLQIDNFSVLDEKTILLGHQELIIKRIAAVNPGSYHQQFVYLETEPSAPTGLSENIGIDEQIAYWGFAKEEFSMFEGRMITTAEHDDNTAVIDGKVVNLGGQAKARVRYLTPYNLIVCAQEHPINNNRFDRVRDQMLNKILRSEGSLEELTAEILKLPKIQRY